MTKNIPAINTSTDTWGDVILRINEIIYFARDNAITTGADSNDGDVILNGNFSASNTQFRSVTANTINVSTANTATLSTVNGTANSITVNVLTAQTAVITNLTTTVENLSANTITAKTSVLNIITSNNTITANTINAVKTVTATANVDNITVSGATTANTITAKQIISPSLTLSDGNNVLTISKTTFDDIDDQLNDKIQETSGTWTPMISIGGNTSNITYSSRNGNYVKVGKLVHANFNLELSSKATQTGNITITNLPVKSANNILQQSGVFVYSNMTSLTSSIVASANNSTTWSLKTEINGNITNANLADNSTLSGSITYITD